jgi:hypothetical protein
MATDREPEARAGTVLLKLAGPSLLVLLTTAILILCFFVVFDRREADAAGLRTSLFLGWAAIVAGAAAVQLAWLRQLARSIVLPVEELISAIDHGVPPNVGPGLRRRADWEIRLLFTRVHALIRERGERPAAAAEPAPASGIHERAEAPERVEANGGIDAREGTEATEGIEPVATAGLHRALGAEAPSAGPAGDGRHRAETELLARFAWFAHGVGRLADEIAVEAADRERAFVTLLEAVAVVREARLSIDPIARELERGEGGERRGESAGRAGEMLEVLRTRLDAALAAIGNVSGAAEGDAARGRALSRRARGLRLEAEGALAGRPHGSAGGGWHF